MTSVCGLRVSRPTALERPFCTTLQSKANLPRFSLQNANMCSASDYCGQVQHLHSQHLLLDEVERMNLHVVVAGRQAVGKLQVETDSRCKRALSLRSADSQLLDTFARRLPYVLSFVA